MDLPDEIIRIPVASLSPENPLLQSTFWGAFKERFGWTAYAVRLGEPRGDSPLTMLVLFRTLPGGFAFAYVPHGPAWPIPINEPNYLAKISVKLPELMNRRVDLVRFDLPGETDGSDDALIGLNRSPVAVQPPDTVTIDLLQSDDQILAAMKSKTRYNVRLAEKRGVTVRDAIDSELPVWYEIYRETAERDRIAIHSLEYYQTLFELAHEHETVDVSLHLAEVEDEVVAGNIVATCGGIGCYLFGASSNRHRNYMPTYLLQWHGIRHCKLLGCHTYDLGGIPPTDDLAHPMHGLYRMKIGFGGDMVRRGGAWDYSIAPVRSKIYRSAERVREFYYKKIRKGGR